ncbi:MAG: translation elongation factor P [Parcubacteria group bacterium Athens1014_10]|nr:MAG: translation elongation factor P [Parcubacteria group bacterium Athens1014_10]TSD05874.1 MAG: translation elongation factor P [Parcubacteria group bacterium Athens0714_12]
MISLNNLKPGLVILIDKTPCFVVSAQHVHMGRGGAILKVKFKNLLNGNTLEKTFKGNEKLEEANLQKNKASFLYKDREKCYFMDNSTYEQFFLSHDLMGEKINYLKESQEVETSILNNEIINIELPPKIDLKVISAPPGARGDTAQGNVTKEVTLETGIKIQAPLFIKEGDILKINTETGKYVERI